MQKRHLPDSLRVAFTKAKRPRNNVPDNLGRHAYPSSIY